MALNRPQNTCGSHECLDAWKHLGRDARLKHKNLATYTKSERALILSQGPTYDELEAQAAQQAALDNEVLEHQTAQQKKETPKFIREMFNPNNLINTGGDPIAQNELPRTAEEAPSGSDSTESEDPVDFDKEI